MSEDGFVTMQMDDATLKAVTDAASVVNPVGGEWEEGIVIEGRFDEPVSQPIEERITVQELIDRCVAEADAEGTKPYTRLLFLNTVRALVEIVTRLAAAEERLDTLSKPASNLVFMPTRGN